MYRMLFALAALLTVNQASAAAPWPSAQRCDVKTSAGRASIPSEAILYDEQEQKDPLVAVDRRDGTIYWYHQKDGKLTVKPADDSGVQAKFDFEDELGRPLSADDMQIDDGKLYLRSTFSGRLFQLALPVAAGSRPEPVDEPYMRRRMTRGGFNLSAGTDAEEVFATYPVRWKGQTFESGIEWGSGVLKLKSPDGKEQGRFQLMVGPGRRLIGAVPLDIRTTRVEGRLRTDLFVQVDEVHYAIHAKGVTKGLRMHSRVLRYPWASRFASVPQGPRVVHSLDFAEASWICGSLNTATRMMLGTDVTVLALVRGGQPHGVGAQWNGAPIGEFAPLFKLVALPPAAPASAGLVSAGREDSFAALDPQEAAWQSARSYLDVKWTYRGTMAYVKPAEKPRHLARGSDYTTVVYGWGCRNTPESFLERQRDPSYLEGNVGKGSCTKIAGVDCSGLVSNVWKFKERFSTADLNNQHAERLQSHIDLRTGDALNQPAAHIRLVGRLIPSPSAVYVEVIESASICGGVCHRILPLALFDRYVPVRGKRKEDAIASQ